MSKAACASSSSSAAAAAAKRAAAPPPAPRDAEDMREDATGARDRERADRVPRGGEEGGRTTGRDDARTLLVSEGRARGKFE